MQARGLSETHIKFMLRKAPTNVWHTLEDEVEAVTAAISLDVVRRWPHSSQLKKRKRSLAEVTARPLSVRDAVEQSHS